MGIENAVSRYLMKRLTSLSGLGLSKEGQYWGKNSEGIKK